MVLSPPKCIIELIRSGLRAVGLRGNVEELGRGKFEMLSGDRRVLKRLCSRRQARLRLDTRRLRSW